MQENIQRLQGRPKVCTGTDYANARVMKPPAYLRHSTKDLAYVYVNGQQVYLGKWQSPESTKKYRRILAELEANNGRLYTVAPPTVADIACDYLEHVEAHAPSQRHLDRTVKALRKLVDLYESELADDFRPSHFKTVRNEFLNERVQRGEHTKRLSRQYITSLTDIIKRAFRHGVENETVHPDTYSRLMAVKNLEQRDRTGAPEWGRRNPVELVPFVSTVWHLRPVLQALCLFQWWTGARPGEAVIMRPCDIDTAGDVWRYAPSHHKTEHLGKTRTILIGPKAQEVLAPYMTGKPEGYCFTIPNTDKPYSVAAYRQAIQRAATRVGVEEWTPHQIRHAAASRFADELGLLAASDQLGHAKADTTLIYSHRKEQDALKAAREMS